MLNVEDGRLNRDLPCSPGGTIGIPPGITFRAPGPKSLAKDRLILAEVQRGMRIKASIPMPHQIVFTVTPVSDPGPFDNQLLIRVPVGVQVFQIYDSDNRFFYYETGNGYNVVPMIFAPGSDPGQFMTEVVLVVSPVPPTDASEATEPFDAPELTLDEVNTRREQVGLGPLSIS